MPNELFVMNDKNDEIATVYRYRAAPRGAYKTEAMANRHARGCWKVVRYVPAEEAWEWVCRVMSCCYDSDMGPADKKMMAKFFQKKFKGDGERK